MAMNKKEQEAMVSLRTELALAWPREKEPARINMSHLTSSTLMTAWTFSSYSRVATRGCTNGVHHNRDGTDKTKSQGAGGPWYNTERDALLAIRWQVCRDFAKALREIDRAIEQQQGV